MRRNRGGLGLEVVSERPPPPHFYFCKDRQIDIIIINSIIYRGGLKRGAPCKSES